MRIPKWLFGIICGLIVSVGAITARPQQITASTPFAFSTTGVVADCPAASASLDQYCFTTTGLYEALGTTTWTLVGGASASPTLTINGVQKTLPASFTISATSTAPTVTLGTVTATVPTDTVTAQ